MTARSDPLGVRADFPVVENRVYLNSAYITPHPWQVAQVGQQFLEAKATLPLSLEAMLEETNRTRESVARLIGASPQEVGFLDSTSAAENVLARGLRLGPQDNVVVDELHYDTTYLLYDRLRAEGGLELRVAPQRDGVVDPAEVRALVDDNTRIVSVAWVAHQNGFRHDLKQLSKIAHSHGALLYVDAIQGLGTLNLDVRAEGVDVLSAGAFKWLLGGFGTAVVFVREEVLDAMPPDRYGAMHVVEKLGRTRFRIFDTAQKYEYASAAYASIYQLRVGVEYLMDIGIEAIENHTVQLATQLRDGLVAQSFDVLTPPNNRSSIVSFVHGMAPTEARASLERAELSVTLREDDTQTRVSPALFNNADEIEAFLNFSEGWARASRGKAL